MEGLGREFNVIAVADDVYVPLKVGQGVSFVCFLAVGDTFTLTEATSAAGAGAQGLAVITKTWQGSGVGGAWVKVTQAAASTVAIATNDCAVIELAGSQLSDGYTHAKVASTGAGTVVAVVHGLAVQRDPAKLAALV